MEIAVKATYAHLVKDESLVQNSDKLYIVEFRFDQSWDGYAKSAVFEAGGVQQPPVAVTGLAALAYKAQISEADLDTALKAVLDGKASGADLATLIGTDAGKSARTIANEELAAQLIPEGAQEALDTLTEIAQWIQDHRRAEGHCLRRDQGGEVRGQRQHQDQWPGDRGLHSPCR